MHATLPKENSVDPTFSSAQTSAREMNDASSAVIGNNESSRHESNSPSDVALLPEEFESNTPATLSEVTEVSLTDVEGEADVAQKTMKNIEAVLVSKGSGRRESDAAHHIPRVAKSAAAKAAKLKAATSSDGTSALIEIPCEPEKLMEALQQMRMQYSTEGWVGWTAKKRSQFLAALRMDKRHLARIAHRVLDAPIENFKGGLLRVTLSDTAHANFRVYGTTDKKPEAVLKHALVVALGVEEEFVSQLVDIKFASHSISCAAAIAVISCALQKLPGLINPSWFNVLNAGGPHASLVRVRIRSRLIPICFHAALC